MQLIAMLTMLIDHIGVIFFPEDASWRIIGRLAFPLYAFLLVQGYYRTRNSINYMKRLAILALIAQLPFSLLFATWEWNAIVTLWIGLMTIYLLDLPSLRLQWKFATVSIVILLALFLPFDYGLYGILLIWIYRYATAKWWILLHLVLNIVVALLLNGWVIQSFSIVATILIVFTPLLFTQLERWTIPRWLWRSFYPAHLALLWILQILLIK